MRTAPASRTLIATFDNERLDLCANVRELPDTNEYEVAIVDSFSGDIVVSRNFNNKETALRMAENLIDIRQIDEL